MKAMPMKKVPGPDNISTEILEVTEESGTPELTHLRNMMYKEGCLPDEMNESIFITIPKVSSTSKCEKQSTIGLMSHVTKLLL